MKYTVNKKGKEISVPLDQEITNINIEIDGEKVEAPNDPRELYMRFEDIRIECAR